MDYSSETRARLAFRLTTDGLLDAVRQGRAVGNEVTFWIDRSAPFWDELFTLHPILEWDVDEWSPDKYVRNIFLPAGRARAVQVVDSEPMWSEASNFLFTTWDRPDIEVLRGDEPGIFSRYFEPDELVQHEVDAERAFESEVALAQARCNALIPKWLDWAAEEGLQTINTTIDSLSNPEEMIFTRNTQLELKLTHQLLTKFRDEGERSLNYDERISWASRLTSMIEKGAQAISHVEDEVTKQSAKRDELAEAREWIEVNGSTRLRKIVDAGLLSASLAVYRTERIELERPGWFVWEPEALRNVINPSEAQVDALQFARRDDAEAKLVWSPTYGRLVLASFLGRQIALTVDEPNSTDDF
jgi:hypothetical protein